VSQEGTYYVTVNNFCGRASDTVSFVYEADPFVTLGPDQELCPNSELLLEPVTNSSQFLWSDNTTAEEFEVNEIGIYWLTVSNFCGSATDSVIITTMECNCELFIPNAFTPDGDALNDFFGGVSNCTLESYHFRIFNRWGELIFESTDRLNYWDGRINGEKAQDGVYVYKVDYKFTESIDVQTKIGSVSVLR